MVPEDVWCLCMCVACVGVVPVYVWCLRMCGACVCVVPVYVYCLRMCVVVLVECTCFVEHHIEMPMAWLYAASSYSS